MEVSKKNSVKNLAEVFGVVAFFIAIITLALINFNILANMPLNSNLLFFSPIFGLFFGLLSLMTPKNNKVFSIWSISLCTFLILFNLLMFGLSWSISPAI